MERHWLGGWCPVCTIEGKAGWFLAVYGFEGWEKRCDQCGRYPDGVIQFLIQWYRETYNGNGYVSEPGEVEVGISSPA